MLYSTPTLLKTTSYEFFNPAIQKRKVFRKLIKKIDDIQLSELENENYIIAGSRAWNKWYIKNIKKSSSSTSNVAYLKGNWDIFVFTSDIKHTLKNMQNMFQRCKEEIQQTLIDEGNISLETTGFTNKKIGNPINMILFPGYELLLSISLYKNAGNLKGKYEYFNDNKQLLIYCKVFPFHIDVKEISNDNYLNEKGLYIFMKMNKTQRIEKGVNIDDKRYTELIKTINLKTDISTLYQKLFSDNLYYDENILSNIHIDILKQNKPNLQYYLNELENWTVEKFRKYINAFLAYMDDLLTGDDNDAYIFLVGGDAMRRHKQNITKTADFDCKIYCKKSWKNKIERLVKSTCSKMIVYLNNNMSNHIYPSKIVFDYFTIIRGSFRLRKIEAHDSFMIDLYSIDFRIKIYGNNVNFNIDIPILDIVIQDFSQLPNKKEIVVYKGNKLASIPIASIPFLLKDIQNTYNYKDTAIKRYWNKKNKKDIERFRKLRDLLEQYTSDNQFEMNIADDNLYEYLRYNFKQDNNISFLKKLKKQYNVNIDGNELAYEAYESELNELIKIKRKQKLVKFKMNFLIQ